MYSYLLAITAPTVTDRVVTARQLGTAACRAHRLRVPALDPQVLPLIAMGTLSPTGAVLVLDAWLQGWDTAMVQQAAADDDTLPDTHGTLPGAGDTLTY